MPGVDTGQFVCPRARPVGTLVADPSDRTRQEAIEREEVEQRQFTEQTTGARIDPLATREARPAGGATNVDGRSAVGEQHRYRTAIGTGSEEMQTGPIGTTRTGTRTNANDNTR